MCAFFLQISLHIHFHSNCLPTMYPYVFFFKTPYVATLALGSRPKQGLARLWTKREAQGGHISCSWECKRVWENEPSHFQVNSHFGSWSPNGLSNFQRAIEGVKTHWIETFLISLESSWNVDVWNGLAWPIWTSKTQVMAKRKAKSQIANLTFDH
jgi:hypothetical protein